MANGAATRPGTVGGHHTCTTDTGVPVLWSPYGGALRARLMFRVGQADETLVTRGVTHLVEHLALSTVGLPTYSFNGDVGDVLTGFDVTGEPEEVAAHLEQVCAALRALPLDRLHVEKGLLGVEEAGSGHRSSAAGELRLRRFGLQNFGLGSALELGLPRLDGAAVSAWAARSFTAGNAVLWLSGPPPADLRLPLPPGPRRPPPLPSPRRLAGPTWYRGDSPVLTMSALVVAGPTAAAAASYLERLLHLRLRTEAGHSYAVSVDVVPLAHGWAELVVCADGLRGHGSELVSAVLRVLGEACATGPTVEALDVWRRGERQSLDEPTAVLGLLNRNARRLLVGDEPQDRDALLAASATVSPDAVRVLLRQMLGTALLQLPEDASAPGPGWTAYPTRAISPVVGGRVFVPAPHLAAGERLVVAPTGVRADGEYGALSILWPDTAAVLRWQNGNRLVVALDGTALEVDPEDWADGAALPAVVDGAAPPDRLVDMPDEGDRTPGTPQLSGFAATSTGALVALIVAVTLSLLAIGSLIFNPMPDGSPEAVYVVVGVLALADYGLGRALYRRLRVPKAVRRPEATVRTGTDVRVDSAIARARTGTLLLLAGGTWLLTAALVVVFALRGYAFWPAVFLFSFAIRVTVEYRRR